MKEPSQPVPMLAFRLAQQYYALSIEYVIEVAAMVSLSQFPEAAPAMMGIANRHGKVLPIIDMRAAFHLPEAQITAETLFIVVEYDEQMAGLIVDEVLQVKYVLPDALQTANGAGRYIERVISSNEQLLQVVTLPDLLATYLMKPTQRTNM